MAVRCGPRGISHHLCEEAVDVLDGAAAGCRHVVLRPSEEKHAGSRFDVVDVIEALGHADRVLAAVPARVIHQ